MSPSEANRKQLYRVADAMVILSMSRSCLSMSRSAPAVCGR